MLIYNRDSNMFMGKYSIIVIKIMALKCYSTGTALVLFFHFITNPQRAIESVLVSAAWISVLWFLISHDQLRVVQSCSQFRNIFG